MDIFVSNLQTNSNFFSEAQNSIVFKNSFKKEHILLIVKGTIYNTKELQHKFNLPSDNIKELIISLYSQVGIEFLNYLNGSFSIVLYDIKQKQLFCAVDRYGQNTLFYYILNKSFIISSDIKNIIKTLPKIPSPNQASISQYFQFFSPIENNTIYSNIFKLQGSYYLQFDIDKKEYKYKKYHKQRVQKSIFNQDKAYSTIKDRLFNSLSTIYNSNHKLAFLLSGGVDSSLLCSIYTHISNKQIDTFSVAYKDYKRYDESSYAQIVSEHINSKHHKINITKELFIENIDEVLDIFSVPFGDSASISLNILNKQIKAYGFDSILSGEGSDELFLGYNSYQKLLKFHNFSQSLSSPQLEFLNEIVPSVQNHTKESEYLLRVAKREFLYNSFGETYNNLQKHIILKKAHFYSQKSLNSDFFDSLSLIDMNNWLYSVLLYKVDTLSSYYKLQAKMPFLDNNLVDASFSIEPRLKLINGDKSIIKEIAKEFLPQTIIQRKKKGFSTPHNEWLFSYYKDKILDTILHTCKNSDFFKEDGIKEIYTRAKNGKFKQHLWLLFIFSKWYNKIYL